MDKDNMNRNRQQSTKGTKINRLEKNTNRQHREGKKHRHGGKRERAIESTITTQNPQQQQQQRIARSEG